MFDGGAPFYDTYATSDGGFMAVGAMEPAFYAVLLNGLDLADDPDLPAQYDPSGWDELRRRFTERFSTRTRNEWTAVFADLDACVAPVLAPGEAHEHPHNAARGTFVEVGGEIQPPQRPASTARRRTGQPRHQTQKGTSNRSGDPHRLAPTPLTTSSQS
ncbi:CoA transferase [Micromonospora sp. M12]